MEKLISLFRFLEDKILGWKKSFLGPLENNKGQTLVSWIVLLSVILTLTLSVSSAINLIEDRQQLMTICRMESLKTQQDVEPLIKKLFAFNPQSRLLRVLMLTAKTRLAAALAHYNIPMAARARYDISQIRNKQQFLDRSQRSLIQAANIILHSGTLKTYSKLKNALSEIKNKSLNWAEIEFLLLNPRIPKLAVKREDENLAPVYLARDQFEKRQVTSQFWNLSYKTKGFFKISHFSKLQCHATMEENTWVPKIRRDRL
jgi:hypothetical protein